MNPLLRLFAVGAMLTATCSFAADAFQGKVTLTMTPEKGKPMDMNQSIKGHKVRVDIDADGHEVATIMDGDKLEMVILMAEQKMYMVMPLKRTVEKAAAQSGASDVDVEVTGKTETILGYKCNQMLVKDKGTVTEVWMAEGLGMFMGLGQAGGGGGGGMFGGKKSANAAKWEEAMKGKGGYPLRVIGHDAKGKQTFKMEATKIAPGPLADSLFVPPADYTKFQMPSLGNLLKGGN